MNGCLCGYICFITRIHDPHHKVALYEQRKCHQYQYLQYLFCIYKYGQERIQTAIMFDFINHTSIIHNHPSSQDDVIVPLDRVQYGRGERHLPPDSARPAGTMPYTTWYGQKFTRNNTNLISTCWLGLLYSHPLDVVRGQ